MRRATRDDRGEHEADDISIHALREESDIHEAVGEDAEMISIHALREESDVGADCRRTAQYHFNPRSP